MLDWEDLRHFHALSLLGTLSAAARALGVEHATVARRVAHLEEMIGAKLVDRRGRRLSLTAKGQQIADIATRMSEDALTIERAALNADNQHTGTVRVSAPPALATALLAEPFVRLRQSHPGINVVIIGETRYASLGRREADIAVRMTRPEHGDLTVTKIGEIGFSLYADPAYLAETREADWSFIGYEETMASSPQETMLARIAGGRPVAIRATALEFQLAAVKAGGGVALLPDFMAADLNLTTLPLPDGPLTRELWLVVHTDIKDVPLIRAVTDELGGKVG
ncbi:MAG: LysR family transcriptional regulator [Mesorhizobium sp.]|nr:LysR family transcriptional regulator [bacterium M00.F.Ca.ET.205.01.1.1]TGU47490.1 LysR family transcriptional regulator [bacterium M00.F.Ca.ET.152.01.1.1]TGV32191.1 LysR family transcriptional regulator [Mesorhizobium sp. M00.F.Ca.ET.186.01.1.1]TGZ39266.1 LysR family transcriptional regulator [bacterium M00.F.Ca.ET.162.01.1.1]TIW60807.1 MAG: LysR family transcriptional regulator [Mesorhizobium sp.]